MSSKSQAKNKNNLPTLTSTQMWSPVWDVRDGIVITKDWRYIKILEFAPINFVMRTEDEQHNIAAAYGAIIRIMPKNFQIKVLSLQADVEDHVRHIEEFMEKEPNPFCQQMQQESVRLIRASAKEGVSRRFLICFEHTFAGGLTQQSFQEIRRSLSFISNQIAATLSAPPFNNVLLNPADPQEESAHILNLLYQCMNRNEAEIKNFDNKIQDVILNYIMEKELPPDATIPVTDFIAPAYIDPGNHKCLDAGGKHYIFGYIPQKAYPANIPPGWLSPLINMGEGIDLDVFVSKIPSDKVQRQLVLALRMNKAQYSHQDDTSTDFAELESRIQSSYYIRDGLASGQDFLYYGILITVCAKSRDEVQEKFRWVKNNLITYGINLRPISFRHEEAYKASLPLANPGKCFFNKAKRNILSGDFGALYPFTSYEINDAGGIMLGVSRDNQSPVFLNPFNTEKYNNANMAILGTSGAGKTYLLQCMALRLRQQQVRTIIIAPLKGHEFRRACKAVGGQFITIGPGSGQNINIMDIRQKDNSASARLDGPDAAGNSILAQKIQQLHIFISLLCPDISHEEKQALDEALVRTYGNYGITMRNGSLYDPANPTRYKKMPILGDLQAELIKDRKSRRIADLLGRFTTGSAKSFNGPTNVSLDNSYVVIDVSSLTKELLPIGIYIATEFVYDAIRTDRTERKCVIFDELWYLIGSKAAKEAAEFVLDIFKTVRAYNTMAVAATQDLNDFFALDGGVYGKGILGNARSKIVMRLERSEAKWVSELLELSGYESAQLTQFSRGQALLLANQNHLAIQVQASQPEHDLITTDPADLREQLERQNAGG